VYEDRLTGGRSLVPSSGGNFTLYRHGGKTSAPVPVQATPPTAAPLPKQTTSNDYWDVSQGTVVTGTSGVLGPPIYDKTFASDIRDMFGGRFAPIEPGNTLFQDRYPAGTVHWVEWKTPAPVSIHSFELTMSHDGPQNSQVYPAMMRGVSRFSLHMKTVHGSFLNIFELLPADPYGNTSVPSYVTLQSNATKTLMKICVNLLETHAQEFRAEFVQKNLLPGFENASGPRIAELDGYAGDCNSR
jgi:hypothetical protein